MLAFEKSFHSVSEALLEGVFFYKCDHLVFIIKKFVDGSQEYLFFAEVFHSKSLRRPIGMPSDCDLALIGSHFVSTDR